MKLENLPERCKDDYRIVLAAVTENGWVMRFVSDTIKDDRDIVFAAVTSDGLVLHFASERLKNDVDIYKR